MNLGCRAQGSVETLMIVGLGIALVVGASLIIKGLVSTNAGQEKEAATEFINS